MLLLFSNDNNKKKIRERDNQKERKQFGLIFTYWSRRPSIIEPVEYVSVTLGAVRGRTKRRQVRYLSQRRSQSPVFHITTGLRNSLIENIKQMLCKLVFELFVVISALMNRCAMPFSEPIIKAVGYEDAVANPG